ncbi:DUF5949 family protein [Streptomyces sp. HMX112]|uniref:DUF5949 family protein n=1 Tax=Streptomyces sp. HMX112 TaxID=3390850 RepID=UPI003A804207
MTSSTVESPGQQSSPLGTLSVLPWSSEASSGSPGTPFLLMYSLGDGREGPEAGEAALRAELERLGLSVGDRLTDLGREPQVPVKLLVEAQQVVLNTPFMKVQGQVPVEWEKAAQESGQVYLICALRPWPEAVPGREIDPDRLRAFVSDEELLASSVHCLLPVMRVRG